MAEGGGEEAFLAAARAHAIDRHAIEPNDRALLASATREDDDDETRGPDVGS